jgi:DNA-binding response OmpR family regulator
MARVLLAEADRHIREFIAGILIDCGHAVEACADGAEASARLATRAVDIVVTDLVLDLGTGADFGHDCAALGIPTITLSGGKFHPDQAAVERPRILLEKPFRFADLQYVLDAVGNPFNSARKTPIERVAPGRDWTAETCSTD